MSDPSRSFRDSFCDFLAGFISGVGHAVVFVGLIGLVVVLIMQFFR